MKSIVTVVLAFFLFFILSPGILLRVPRKGGKLVVAAVHAIVFSVIYSIIHYFLLKSKIFEGFPHDNPWLGYNNPLPQPRTDPPSWVQERMNALASPPIPQWQANSLASPSIPIPLPQWDAEST
jgi:hypothetical protein